MVLIPIGALEQHGSQCPLGTDEIISEAVARRIEETPGPGDPPTIPC